MKLITFLFSILLFVSLNARANVLGEMQTFAPNTDGLDFITVHSARALNEGHFAFSNYFNYAKDHLLAYRSLADQDSINYSSHLFEYDFGVSYGISKKLQVSLMSPILLDYSGEQVDNIHVEVTRGVHSLRPGTKWSFYESGDQFAALLFSVDFPVVTNSPYTGTSPRPIYNLETAYTLRQKTATHGFNIGYRKRQPSDIPADGRMFPLKDQLIFSYGYSQKLTQTTRFVFEFFGSHPIDKDPYQRTMDASSYDLLFAAKHFWWKYLRFDWGATVEPGVKSLSPTWRVFAGLVYYWKNDLGGTSEAEQENLGLSEVEKYHPPTEPLPEAAPELTINPEHVEIVEGEAVDFEVTGGRYPYDFRVASGQGLIDSAGVYQAPSVPTHAVIEVQDQIGQTKKAIVDVVSAGKPDKVIRLQNLKFVFGKDELIPESKRTLDHDLKELEGTPIKQIIVEGHTDNIGKIEANRLLGRRRARVIRRHLLERLNLASQQVKSVSFGEERPLVSNKTVKGRQINRRVELKVYWKSPSGN
jgi:outer membrane protein OmpA-like peptidoglycan-associated protein